MSDIFDDLLQGESKDEGDIFDSLFLGKKEKSEYLGIDKLRQDPAKFAGDYWKYLHSPTEPAKGVGDFVKRVVPASAGKTAIGLAEFPYHVAKSVTTPLIESAMGKTEEGEPLDEGRGIHAVKGLGEAVYENLEGVARFIGEPLGAYGWEALKEKWLSDPVGGAIGIAPFVKGLRNYSKSKNIKMKEAPERIARESKRTGKPVKNIIEEATGQKIEAKSAKESAQILRKSKDPLSSAVEDTTGVTRGHKPKSAKSSAEILDTVANSLLEKPSLAKEKMAKLETSLKGKGIDLDKVEQYSRAQGREALGLQEPPRGGVPAIPTVKEVEGVLKPYVGKSGKTLLKDEASLQELYKDFSEILRDKPSRMFLESKFSNKQLDRISRMKPSRAFKEGKELSKYEPPYEVKYTERDIQLFKKIVKIVDEGKFTRSKDIPLPKVTPGISELGTDPVVLRTKHGTSSDYGDLLAEEGKFRKPSEVPDDARWEEGMNVMGRSTYFDETGKWVDNIYETDLDMSKAYDTEITLEKPLLVSPGSKGLKELTNILDNPHLGKGTDAVRDLIKEAGYDSVVFRGFDEHMYKYEKQKADPKTTDKQYEKLENKQDAYRMKFMEENTRGYFFEDEIVTFYPETQARILSTEEAGSKPFPLLKEVVAKPTEVLTTTSKSSKKVSGLKDLSKKAIDNMNLDEVKFELETLYKENIELEKAGTTVFPSHSRITKLQGRYASLTKGKDNEVVQLRKDVPLNRIEDLPDGFFPKGMKQGSRFHRYLAKREKIEILEEMSDAKIEKAKISGDTAALKRAQITRKKLAEAYEKIDNKIAAIEKRSGKTSQLEDTTKVNFPDKAERKQIADDLLEEQYVQGLLEDYYAENLGFYGEGYKPNAKLDKLYKEKNKRLTKELNTDSITDKIITIERKLYGASRTDGMDLPTREKSPNSLYVASEILFGAMDKRDKLVRQGKSIKNVQQRIDRAQINYDKELRIAGEQIERGELKTIPGKGKPRPRIVESGPDSSMRDMEKTFKGIDINIEAYLSKAYERLERFKKAGKPTVDLQKKIDFLESPVIEKGKYPPFKGAGIDYSKLTLPDKIASFFENKKGLSIEWQINKPVANIRRVFKKIYENTKDRPSKHKETRGKLAEYTSPHLTLGDILKDKPTLTKLLKEVQIKKPQEFIESLEKSFKLSKENIAYLESRAEGYLEHEAKFDNAEFTRKAERKKIERKELRLVPKSEKPSERLDLIDQRRAWQEEVLPTQPEGLKLKELGGELVVREKGILKQFNELKDKNSPTAKILLKNLEELESKQSKIYEMTDKLEQIYWGDVLGQISKGLLELNPSKSSEHSRIAPPLKDIQIKEKVTALGEDLQLEKGNSWSPMRDEIREGFEGMFSPIKETTSSLAHADAMTLFIEELGYEKIMSGDKPTTIYENYKQGAILADLLLDKPGLIKVMKKYKVPKPEALVRHLENGLGSSAQRLNIFGGVRVDSWERVLSPDVGNKFDYLTKMSKKSPDLSKLDFVDTFASLVENPDLNARIKSWEEPVGTLPVHKLLEHLEGDPLAVETYTGSSKSFSYQLSDLVFIRFGRESTTLDSVFQDIYKKVKDLKTSYKSSRKYVAYANNPHATFIKLVDKHRGELTRLAKEVGVTEVKEFNAAITKAVEDIRAVVVKQPEAFQYKPIEVGKKPTKEQVKVKLLARRNKVEAPPVNKTSLSSTDKAENSRILTKIVKEGYDKLSKEEKAFVEQHGTYKRKTLTQEDLAIQKVSLERTSSLGDLADDVYSKHREAILERNELSLDEVRKKEEGVEIEKPKPGGTTLRSFPFFWPEGVLAKTSKKAQEFITGFINNHPRLRADVDSWHRFWDPLSTLPDSFKYREQRYKMLGGLDKAERWVLAIHKRTKKFSLQQRREMFRYLDGRADITALPEALRPYAKSLKNANILIGRILVRRGLLTKEAFNKHKGKYIRYLYVEHVVGRGHALTSISPSIKLTREYLKNRKDLTPGQRKALGFIEDVSIAQPIGMIKPAMDIRKWDFMTKLQANPEWVAKDSWLTVEGRRISIGKAVSELEQAKEVLKAMPDVPEVVLRVRNLEAGVGAFMEKHKLSDALHDFEMLPNTPGYGPLAGAFVRREIARDITPVYAMKASKSNIGRIVHIIAETEAKGMAAFKVGKTALNVPTGVRNVTSNYIQMNLSGIPFLDIPKYMKTAIISMKNKDSHYNQGLRNGLFKTNWGAAEIGEVFDIVKEIEGSTNYLDIMGKVKKMAKFYGKIDDFYKLTKYIEQVENGASKAKAVQEAQKWGMDYSLADPSIKFGRRHITPFITYQYKVAPLVMEAATKRPWTLAKYVAVPYIIQEISKYSMDLSEDDWDKLKKDLPLFVKKTGSYVVIPWKSPEGNIQWVNLEYFIPWQGFMAAKRDFKEGHYGELVGDFGIGNPFLDIYTVAKTTRDDDPPSDPFTGRDIYSRLDSPTDKALATANWLYEKWAPTMATGKGFAGYAKKYLTGEENRYGKKVSGPQAGGRLLGINIISPDPAAAGREKQFKVRELKISLRRKLSDPNLSQKKKDAAIQRYQNKIEQLINR